MQAFLSRRVDGDLPDRRRSTRRDTVRMLKRAGIPVVEGGNLTDDPIDMVVGYSNIDAAQRDHPLPAQAQATRRSATSAPSRRTTIARATAAPATRRRCAAARRQADPAALRSRPRSTSTPAPRRWASCSTAGRDVRAVFCSADALAVGALYECQRRGLAVPGDVAIAGFDDIVLAAQVVPALTTIRVPRYEIGKRAGTMLCDRLAKRPVRQQGRRRRLQADSADQRVTRKRMP